MRKPDPLSKSGKIRELLKTGMSAAQIAAKVGCTVGLVYNVKSTAGGNSPRGPSRKRSAGGTNAGGLDGLLAAVKDSERDRAAMRSTLERIQAMIADVLD